MQHDMDMIVSDKKQARLWAKRLHVALLVSHSSRSGRARATGAAIATSFRNLYPDPGPPYGHLSPCMSVCVIEECAAGLLLFALAL